jgi:large subunit ribosomal protein L25
MQSERVQLTAQPRTVLGKKTRFLRREGWTPANLTGRGKEPTAIQLQTREIEHVLTHVPRTALLALKVEGGREETVLIRAVDRKPTNDELYHVELFGVAMDEKLLANIPLVLVGDAPAAATYNASILRSIDTLPVECLPGDLPNNIEVDLSRLIEVDDAIYVRDLVLPRGVVTTAPEDELVAKAAAPAVVVEEEGEEAAEAEAAEAGEAAEGEAAETEAEAEAPAES